MSAYTWPRDLLIPGLGAVLTSLWAYAWVMLGLASVPGPGAPDVGLPWVAVLVGVPALGWRWLDSGGPGPRWLRRALLLAGAAVLPLVFVLASARHIEGASAWTVALAPFRGSSSPDATRAAFEWLVGALLVGCGLWLGASGIGAGAAARWLLAGLAAFAILAAVTSGDASPRGFVDTAAWLPLLLAVYFVLGLGWVALVRQQEVELDTFGQPSSFDPSSFLLFCGLAALAVAAGTAAAGLGSGLLRFVGAVALGLLALAIVAGMTVAAWLGEIVHALLRLLSTGRTPGGEQFLTGLSPGEPLGPTWEWPRWTIPAIHLPFDPVAATGVITVAVIVAWILIGAQRVGGDSQGIGEEHSSLWSWRLPRDLARTAGRDAMREFADAWRRLVRRAGRASSERGLADTWDDARRPRDIRAVYREVLARCAERGRSRSPSQTPWEYEPTLARESSGELAADLTAAYVRARYAEEGTPEETARALWDRWHQSERADSDSGPQDSEADQ